MLEHFARFRSLLRSGEVLRGLWMSMAHLDVCEMVADAGFDWVIFDLEHAPIDLSRLETALGPFRAARTVPLVRVPQLDQAPVKQALDLGAGGIVFPCVEGREGAEAAVSLCRYPPAGRRGYGPRRASNYNRDGADYARCANDAVSVLVQIESKDGCGNVSDIVSVPGVDGVLVGLMDLSGSLGRLGRLDDPELTGCVDAIIASARTAGIGVGVAAAYGSSQAADRWVRAGARFVTLGDDAGLFRSALERLTAEDSR